MYNRRGGLFGGGRLLPQVIKYLLITNITIFILETFFFQNLSVGNVNLGEAFLKNFALWPLSSGLFMPWQIVTYMFMHGGFMHILINMFILWMFGFELETIWGPKKFFWYYIMCGVGAGLANLFIAPLFTTVGPTVGASGAIYGILAAFAFLFPNRKIYLYFFIPIKAKYLIVLYMAFDLFSVIGRSDTGIAHVAHLGGAIVGIIYLLITKKTSGTGFFQDVNKGGGRFTSQFSTPGRKKESTFGGWNAGTSPKKVQIKEDDFEEVDDHDYKKEMDDNDKTAQEKIDAILDKLSEGGYQSLTEEEKKVLFQESKKLR
jgi:membrane associated rhomboid family serine protease